MTYSITDLSKKFNLPASTIRYYEKIGLLENVEHVNSYRRVYNDSHIDRLNAIECFKKALLPPDEIRLFFTASVKTPINMKFAKRSTILVFCRFGHFYKIASTSSDLHHLGHLLSTKRAGLTIIRPPCSELKLFMSFYRHIVIYGGIQIISSLMLRFFGCMI